MSLRYDDRWIWDFWVAIDGPDVHLFHLQAPRSLGDPELRHRWHMLCSGISRAEDDAVQRIGRATSADLVTWERHGAILEADPRWYETVGAGAAEEHWRDPWAFRDPATGRFHVLVCARAATGPADGRGVIGHAWSADLEAREVGPPLSVPGELRQLEVPQLVRLGGAWRVLFSATEGDHSAARLARPGVRAEGGTHALTGDARLGPFALDRDDFVLGDARGSWYAGRVVEHGGAPWLLAWRRHDDDGSFVGELGDPMPLEIGADGWPAVGPASDARRA
jgi:beta-fructofuranosidase